MGKGRVLNTQGDGNQPLKWKNLLWFITEPSLIRPIDESYQVKMLQMSVI